MADEKDRSFRILEKTKIIVEILAILVAGYWTYLKFIRTEAPLFETNASIDRDLSPAEDRGGSCLRFFNVTLENTGKSAFTVERVVTRVWKFPLQEDKAVEFVDLDRIEAQEPVFQKEFPDPAFGDKARWYPFLGRHRSGETYSHSFQFLFKKEVGAWIFVKTEIFIEGEAEPEVAGMWDSICG